MIDDKILVCTDCAHSVRFVPWEDGKVAKHDDDEKFTDPIIASRALNCAVDSVTYDQKVVMSRWDEGTRFLAVCDIHFVRWTPGTPKLQRLHVFFIDVGTSDDVTTHLAYELSSEPMSEEQWDPTHCVDLIQDREVLILKKARVNEASSICVTNQ